MKFLLTFLFLLSSSAFAQGIPDSFVYHDAMMLSADTVRADSGQTAPKRRLLPENMSFVEKGLWGERGLLRGIGIASPLTPGVRKSELSLRRTMLSMHQIGGFVTLGLMGTAVYYGQKSLDNVNSPNYRSYRNNHQTFVALTIGSYSLTGLLAILAPPPLIRRDEFSTTTLHKTLAWVHFVGMVVTPIIGASLHSRLNDDQRARFHQYSAYITTAALATSLIVITF
jgi:hypothetical protein